MEISIIILFFLIGIFCGSFITLAVYRIPLKQDILIKHSYCPNCNHKLGFFDLFPIFSYIFLCGKCRYCKTKIRLRYFIIELLCGIVFVFLGYSLFFRFKIIDIFFYLIYVILLFIIAGIDKECGNISKGVLIFGYIVEFFYIIYQCTLGNINVYQYVIYLILSIIVLLLTAISYSKNINFKYYIKILYLSLFIIVFHGSIIFILSAILTLLAVAINSSVNKKGKIIIGFYLCISNILVIIISEILKYCF